ncbi:MAG: UvrD-helicase domain-containing protein, partial [Methanobacterium sp.]
MPNRKIIIGPPGTGKTTKLLNIVEEAILNGVATDKIALLTFTKKASEEAITRAAAKFKLSRKKFPFFKT